MYHSINISGKNTFTEWGLVPTSRPLINPPQVKTSYVDLPSSHGQLDYTEYLLQEVPYGQREGSWEFTLRPRNNWANVYSTIMNYLHGRRHIVILEDNPLYQYVGRLSVNEWRSDQSRSFIVIDYNLDPFKYSVEASDDTEWLWDDLFADCIKYGRFTVTGQKWRNFINAGLREAIPTITCSAAMTLKIGNDSFALVKGINTNANFALQPGDNEMLFIGNGDVVISYREVSL